MLDEPTSGVGPLGSARLWEEIRQAATAGAGVLVTTHNMEEAEQCDRLMIMADGKVAAAGTSDDITAGRTVAEVRTAQWSRAFALLDASRLPVQLHGTMLRVGGQSAAVQDCSPARASTRPSRPSRRISRRHSWQSSGRQGHEPHRPAARNPRYPRRDPRRRPPQVRHPRLRRHLSARHRDRGGGGPGPGDPLLRHERGALHRRDRAAARPVPGSSQASRTIPLQDFGEALARGYLSVVDSDDSRNAILALVRSAVSHERPPPCSGSS